MSYKVLIVEDEIVTREGIRDNVDWQANGFELCGEAPDGEIALPLLQAAKPDVLITDIKMPFMDGLQLCKIVRERMPQVKVVILSGHDEFEYAQEAIKLGVTEYLLKPVTVQDMHRALQRVARTITREEEEQADLARLRDQVRENHAALTERLVFKLLVGAIPLSEAIEQSEVLGIDLVARCYAVAVIRAAPACAPGPFDYSASEQVHATVAGVVASNPDAFILRKDFEEIVLILKGNTPEYLQEERELILTQIERRAAETGCPVLIGVGAPCERLADIGRSFLEALTNIQQDATADRSAGPHSVDSAELLKVDRSAVEDYLKCGVADEFDDFFNAFLLPLEPAFRSAIVKNYILLDLVFTTARFVQSLGGEVDAVLPDLDQMETVLTRIHSIEQIREQAQEVMTRALEFRDSRVQGMHAGVIQQARDYIEQHYTDPDISLPAVAGLVGHSPCHFSTMFGTEMGQSFKEYVTALRIKRAKELMRTTNLKSAEICDRVGYNDPHYFSLVFRKSTGVSPREFRMQVCAAEPKGPNHSRASRATHNPAELLTTHFKKGLEVD